MEQHLVKNDASIEEFIVSLRDDELNGDFEEIYQRAPRTKETRCGFGVLSGRWLQGYVKVAIECALNF
jgi:hypothetical protein